MHDCSTGCITTECSATSKGDGSTPHPKQKGERTSKEVQESGSSILSLSRDVDCPPMSVFRSVLSGLGYSKERIKLSLRNPEVEFAARECREFEAAEEADVISNVNQEFGRQKGSVFEGIVEDYLKNEGIAFVTQSVLEAEQCERFGKTFASPDFLLLDKVEINGSRVTWIDAKASYGTTKLRLRKTRKQVTRYTGYWGPGAIIFLEGSSENFRIDNCTMLSAREHMAPESFDPLLELKDRYFGANTQN